MQLLVCRLRESNEEAPPFTEYWLKPRSDEVLFWRNSQQFKSSQADGGQSIMRSAPSRKRPVTPVAKAGQRHCTWDESVLFNVPPVKLNETAWPPCLASVSASRTGESSVQITVDFVNLRGIVENTGRGFNQALTWIPGQPNPIWHKGSVLSFLY